jgi:transposase
VEVEHPRCAGLDISKRDAKVCVRVVAEGKAKAVREVTTWGARSSQILELGGYLLDQKVSLVVMEATSSYWKPFWHLLDGLGLNVVLVNARQARQIPGRKTDVADCQWLADLGAHGLLRGSFVPPAPVRELKDLVRSRTILVRLRGQEAQRLEKMLEDAAIKLSASVSDIMGVSGRRMIQALIDGERDPKTLAALGIRLKAGKEELVEALTGRFTGHHAFLAKMHLDLVDGYNDQIAKLDQRIEEFFAPGADEDAPGGLSGEERARMAAKRDLLATIPGVSHTVAEQILAEIGPDMSHFPTAAHLASWAGVAPGANESAGRIKSTRCRPGNTYLKGALGIAAMAATRTKDTHLQARYKRVASRRGHSRALVAVEHSILTAVWHILTNNQPYLELGGDYYLKRRPGNAIRKAVDQLRAVGYTVTFPDNAATAIVT